MRILAPTPVPLDLPDDLEHEELVVQTGERSGATMAVAIHSTRLGPALGGARLWHYERPADGVEDVLNLARAMTFKAAAAGLDLGGGKGVICAPDRNPPSGEERTAILDDFGDLVESLDGRYITAEDVGTSTADMVEIATRTSHVTGMPEDRGGSGDPSPVTALGVQAAMRAACRAAFGTGELKGRTVAIAGLGHVGQHLARGLASAGARLVLTDIDPAKHALATELGAAWTDPDGVAESACDVFAPCAVGGSIHRDNVRLLRCRAICGAANNQLADDGLASELAARDIVYAPDFIVNAGGLINVYRELHSSSAERARELALGIEGTMDAVFERSRTMGSTPLEAARALARERLES